MLLLLMVLASSPLELLRAADPDGTAERAERRGLKYLSAEVPGWRPANGCYSCHNNGDGVRALLLARRLKREVPPAAYLPTIEWLEQPDQPTPP